ncbi:MAG TPA: CotH kinase family protein, partial [Verrucomicrobiae bacterium]|nr:CotH kinase family protein [Verrucomicrobiae bacterium]
REVDDKPDLTLDFNRFGATQKFHDLRRIYLNNSVEDPSYCNELLGGELFRAAGVPAPRVAHAIVTLNARRLGLFVLKEGFTEDFLGCYFKHIGANLYEPGDGHDVNQRLKRNAIVAPKQDDDALQSLADAVKEPDPAKRWPRLQQTLDVDEFVKFMAMEVMLGHRDGYSLARNNYRIYQDIDSGKMVFFPHGMDQLFGNPDAKWLPHMSGLTSKAVMETPQGALRYRATFSALFTNVFRVSSIQTQVDQVVAGLRAVLTPSEFAAVQDAANHQKEQIARRQIALAAQLSQPERPFFTFANGEGILTDWVKTDDSAGVKMDQFQADDHTPVMRIVAHSASGASWRTTVLLRRGRYRFEGSLKVTGVKPLAFGKYQGAGLRVAGSVRDSAGLLGDSNWCIEGTEFTVTDETQEVELICELRASAGEAWFDLKSLKLHQLLDSSTPSVERSH